MRYAKNKQPRCGYNYPVVVGRKVNSLLRVDSFFVALTSSCSDMQGDEVSRFQIPFLERRASDSCRDFII